MSGYIFNYSHYKKQINTKNHFNFSVILIVIILLLGACVLLRPQRTKFLEFYFIETGKFQTYQQALNHSQEMIFNGGAGYIYFDKNYHVLVSFYSNYDDAESVLKKIKNDYPSATIFTIKSKHFFKQKNLTNAQNKSIENFANTSKELVLKLDLLSAKFFTKTISFGELKTHIKNMQKEFNIVYENFINSFNNVSKHNLTKKYAVNMFNTFEKLVKFSEHEMCYQLRYEIINLVIERHHLLSCF